MELDLSRWAERKIEEAIEEGVFDNLPGKGRPIDPAYLNSPVEAIILRNAGALPEWAYIDKEIEEGRAACRKAWA